MRPPHRTAAHGPAEGEPAPDAGRARAPGWLALLVLVVLPLGLRLWPIEHGLPENYVPDTHIVRNALGMARDRDLVPEVGRYSSYPYLLPYLLLPVYGAEFALGRAQGEWRSTAEFGERLMLEPERAHRTARWLVALLSALAPWVVWRAARAMGLSAGAWFAAYFVATSLLHVQFSLLERPWGPMVTGCAGAVWAAARYGRTGARRSLVLSGLAAALAAACHQAGLFALGIPGLAWLLSPRAWRGAALRARLLDGVACVAVFFALALVLGYPHYLVHGRVDRAAVAAGDALGENSISIGGQGLVFALRGATFFKLGRALVGYDPLLLACALLGLGSALRSSRGLRVPALFALAWAAFFLTNQGDHVRYLLPLAVLLAWPAGAFAERVWARPRARVVLLAACALPLVQALRLGWILRQPDTRALCAAELARDFARAPLAIDAYGPELPLDRTSLERLAGWRELGARERHRLQSLAPGEVDGFDAVPLEAVFDYDPRSGRAWIEEDERSELGTDPSVALRRLGRRYVVVADRTPGDGRPPLLLDPEPRAEKMPALVVDGDPLLRVDPAGPGGGLTDASLPAELSFPLTQLWLTRRPGPLLELYRLAP